MNMDFHSIRPRELRADPFPAITPAQPQITGLVPASSRVKLKYFTWPIVGAGLLYLASQASAVTLLAIAGACIGLLTIATSVCIYALNNTR